MLPFEPPRSGCSKTHYWSPTVRRNDWSISESNLIKPFKAVITCIWSSCFCFSANQPGSQSLVIHSVWLSVSLVLSRTVSSSRSEWVSKCVCQSVSLFINLLTHYSVTQVVRNSMQVNQSVSQSITLSKLPCYPSVCPPNCPVHALPKEKNNLPNSSFAEALKTLRHQSTIVGSVDKRIITQNVVYKHFVTSVPHPL